MQKYLTLVFVALFCGSLFAQHEPIQPFEELGIKVKVLTLSNGKYQESFPNDTTFRFGSVMFNRVTGEVVSVVVEDTLYGEYDLKPEVVSRWLSPDPLAAALPNWSPYNYALNNPIIFIDPTGEFPYPIHVRSFAPFATFGGGFDGDNRGYSTALGKREVGEGGVTSRVQQSFVVDTDTKDYSDLQTWSDLSHHPVLGDATEQPRGSISNFEVSKNSAGNDIISFTSTMAGKNPLVAGSPDIDVTTHFAITEDKKNGQLFVDATMSGDRFPSAEVLIGDTQGTQLLLGVSPAEGGPFTSLPGDNNRQMMTASMVIRINDKGEFVNISSGGKTYTVEAWNQHMQSQPTEVKKQ